MLKCCFHRDIFEGMWLYPQGADYADQRGQCISFSVVFTPSPIHTAVFGTYRSTGLAGLKKKTIVGHFVFNPLWCWIAPPFHWYRRPIQPNHIHYMSCSIVAPMWTPLTSELLRTNSVGPLHQSMEGEDRIHVFRVLIDLRGMQYA
jgi:hypothetical protein